MESETDIDGRAGGRFGRVRNIKSVDRKVWMRVKGNARMDACPGITKETVKKKEKKRNMNNSGKKGNKHQ